MQQRVRYGSLLLLSTLLTLHQGAFSSFGAQDGGASTDVRFSLMSPDAIRVIAGGGDIGDGAKATEAILSGIGGMAVDRQGNLYLCDTGHNRVRKVDGATGRINTVAGNGDMVRKANEGPATAIELLSPVSLALDADENLLYVAEIVGAHVKRVDLKAGTATDLGSPPEGFRQPVGLLMTSSGLLLVDTVQGQVWRRSDSGWTGLFKKPGQVPGGIRNVVEDHHGNLYLSEYFSHRILKWDASTGDVTVAVGTGKMGRSEDGLLARESTIAMPDGLAIDSEESLYFADMGNNRIAKIDGRTGRLRTLFQARRGEGLLDWSPGPVYLDRRGNLWVGDVTRSRVIKFGNWDSSAQIVAGGGEIGDGGLATRARLSHPGRVAVDSLGNIYFSDAMLHRVRKVDSRTGIITTVAGTGTPGYNGDNIPAVKAELSYPAGVLIDSGQRLFIADYYGERVRVVDLATGIITTVAGTGEGGETGNGGSALGATMLNPNALAIDQKGQLIVTSAVTSSVRTIDLEKRLINGYEFGSSVVPPSQEVVFYGIAIWKNGFYLADSFRSTVWYHEPGKTSVVVSGGPLYYPMDVAVTPDGTLYICDTRMNRIYKWDGTSLYVVLDHLSRPRAIFIDKDGKYLYIAEAFASRILRVSLGKVEAHDAH